MPKYLIEVPHDGGKIACDRAIAIFFSSGNHFLRNADWGCLDGTHKAWFIMDADNKDDARQVVPPAYRKDAIIFQLNKFNPEDFKDILDQHHT